MIKKKPRAYLHGNEYCLFVISNYFILTKYIQQSHVQSRKFLFSTNSAMLSLSLPLSLEIQREENIFKSWRFLVIITWNWHIISRKTREKNSRFFRFSVYTCTINSHRLDESFCFHVIVIRWWQMEGGLYWRNESFKVNDFTISNNDFYGFKCFQLIRLCADSGSRLPCNAQLYSMCITVRANNDRMMWRLR